MNKEEQEELEMLAKFAGLFKAGHKGWKYNYPCDDVPEGRFFCRVEDWRPDQNWNHLMVVINYIMITPECMVRIEELCWLRPGEALITTTYGEVVEFVKQHYDAN